MTGYARLLDMMRQPGAYQRIVDRLPEGEPKTALQAWGIMHGVYQDRLEDHHARPAAPQANQPSD